MTMPRGTEKRDVIVQIRARSLLVKVRGGAGSARTEDFSVMDVEGFVEAVSPDDCTWTVVAPGPTGMVIQVSLEKCERAVWRSLC